MKKLLYTTSALVGAAFLMEAVVPAKAEVNMSMRYRAALISKSKKDADSDKAIEASSDTAATLAKENSKDRSTQLASSKINIDLSASKDHPNGLTTGASLAIATAGRGSGQSATRLDYDNAIGYISGSFGKFEVGDFHDVGYRALGYGTPGTSNFGAIDAGFQPSGGYVNTSATGNIGGRASSLAYWSPSFSGAQVSVSWAPQVSKEGKETSLTSTHGDIEDSMGFAATYSGSFGGTGVSMGVSFENAKQISAKPVGWEGDDVNTANLDTIEANGMKGGTVYFLDSTNGLVSASTAIDAAGEALEFSPTTQDPAAFAGYVSFNISNFTVGGSYGSWESPSSSTDSTVSESTAYALGASYSVDAITFGVGYGTQSTDNVHHNIRSVSGTVAGGGVTAAQSEASTPFKQTLDNDILAFTVGYNLGDGAAIDFVIEQASAESMSLVGTGATRKLGKTETKTSGFGVGLDLKF